MRITIKLFASLRAGRFETATRAIKSGITVRGVCRNLKIPSKEAAIVFVNGIHAAGRKRLKDGDTVAIFPPSGGG